MAIQKEHWDKFLVIGHFTGFALLLAALPLSNFFMSVGTIWLGVVWVLQVATSKARGENFGDRIRPYFQSPQLLLMSGIFLMPLIGMMWTEDTSHGMWDLRMKLPLLFVPFLIPTLNKLTPKLYNALTGIFLVSLIFAVTWCFFVYFHIIPKDYRDVREISVFISHIRFSLLLITGLLITYCHIGTLPSNKKMAGYILLALLSFYFVSFLFVLSSVTGLLVLAILTGFVLIYNLRAIASAKIRYTFYGAIILLIAITTTTAILQYRSYTTPIDTIDFANLPSQTALGNEYNHHPEMPLVENGHYVFTYLSMDEMKDAWLERSTIHPDSIDQSGHPLNGTLIRYLASKSLPKDRSGVMSLNDEDIKNIEVGITDCKAAGKNSLQKRIDNILFELSVFKANGNPSGHSVLQRLEFWRAGWKIFQNNFLIGTGTGDTKAEYKAMYENMHSTLDPKFRLRAHNQYLTMFLTYGIVGGIYFLIVILYPFFDPKRNLLSIGFALIAALSMLTEDTLESQAGVMFYVVISTFIINNRN